MSEVVVRAASRRRDRHAFLLFPWRVHKGDPIWVPPILSERAKRTDPRSGPFFRRGEAEVFVAWSRGRPVGTICAAEDATVSETRAVPTCVFGFFDYLDVPGVPEALVEKVDDWARARGLKQLVGPYDLDYEDGYGVLVEGWTRPPPLLCRHNPRYYAPTMDRLGFVPDGAPAVALGIDLDSPELERLTKIADNVRRRGKLKLRQADFSCWDSEVDTLLGLLNGSLAHLPGQLTWRRDALEPLLQSVRAVADPALVLFAQVENETVGFLAALPDFNQVLLHADGLRTPWSRFVTLLRRRRPLTALTVKSVLVLPPYWRTGAAALLFDELRRRARERGYRWADLSMTSLENPNKTVTLATRLGAREYKRWRVYKRDVPARAGTVAAR